MDQFFFSSPKHVVVFCDLSLGRTVASTALPTYSAFAGMRGAKAVSARRDEAPFVRLDIVGPTQSDLRIFA